jgi:hypothetical protein
MHQGQVGRDEPFLHKPILPEVLLETVARVIEKHAATPS